LTATVYVLDTAFLRWLSQYAARAYATPDSAVSNFCENSRPTSAQTECSLNDSDYILTHSQHTKHNYVCNVGQHDSQ